MITFGLLRQYYYNHSKNIDTPNKRLGTVISKNTNTKYIAFYIFLASHV